MVDFSNFSYVPVLEVRRSEMTAMEELPPADKKSMLPYVILRPWLTANHFVSTVAKVKAAVGHRPAIIDVYGDTSEPDIRRPVHNTFDELRDSTDGYANFYKLMEENENFIPSLQIADIDEMSAQLPRIEDLGRGVSVRLTERSFRYASAIAQELSAIEDQSKIHVLIDFDQQNRDLLNRAAIATSLIEGIRENIPDAFVSVSASTFPASFTSITEQPIFERRFFNEIVRQVGSENVIYSDHGSVRVERQQGGGGAPAPRIDNALPLDWNFFREEANAAVDRYEAFQAAALRAVRSSGWRNLGIWGTSEILQTANGNGAINSAQRSTAVRINIHLHQQANFGGPAVAPDDETDWSD